MDTKDKVKVDLRCRDRVSHNNSQVDWVSIHDSIRSITWVDDSMS